MYMGGADISRVYSPANSPACLVITAIPYLHSLIHSPPVSHRALVSFHAESMCGGCDPSHCSRGRPPSPRYGSAPEGTIQVGRSVGRSVGIGVSPSLSVCDCVAGNIQIHYHSIYPSLHLFLLFRAYPYLNPSMKYRWMIALAGVPGSGKTTTAKILADAANKALDKKNQVGISVCI